MIILSAGMPRAGSGWYFNLMHDLITNSGGQNARQIRAEDAIFSARRFRLRQLGFVDGRGLPVNGKVAPYLDEWGHSPEAEQASTKLEQLIGKRAPTHW